MEIPQFEDAAPPVGDSSKALEVSLNETVRLDPQATLVDGAGRIEELNELFDIHRHVPTGYFTGTERLAAGGAGVVVRGLDPNLKRTVAIKFLRPEFKDKRPFVERFVREARTTSQLEHPNIIPVHELGSMDKHGVYYTMKHVSGVTLQKVLEELRDGNPDYLMKYTRGRLLEVFMDVCNAAAFAHSKGVINRDLKPENIQLGDFGEVMVLDWGLVKRIQGDPEAPAPDAGLSLTAEPGLTVDGSVSGTPAYMSPEQAMGMLEALDERSDIYCLGAILYHILTYAAPFDGKSINAILDQVIKGDFPPPRRKVPRFKIPPELDAICLKAMAKEKADRYQTAGALLADVRHYLDGFSVSALRDPPPVKAVKWCRRHPVVTSTALLTVLLSLLWLGGSALVMRMGYRDIKAAADSHYERGNEELRLAEITFRELDRIRAGRALKEKSARETELERDLLATQVKFENHFETSIMFMLAAPPIPSKGRQLAERIKQISRKQLEYDLMTANVESMLKLLGQLQDWAGACSREDLPEIQRMIDSIQVALKGDGSLSVSSRPSQSMVTLWTFEDDGGVSRKARPRELGRTPLGPIKIAKGSYCLTFKAPGRPAVERPVFVTHGAAVDVKVELPDAIPAGIVYVPAGTFLSGGDSVQDTRLYSGFVEGFFIKEREVTCGEYLEFWRSLADPELRRRYGAALWLDSNDRVCRNAWDDAGNCLKPAAANLPVAGLPLEAAEAYCVWLGKRLGVTARLPTAAEWEKAARGVDGRNYVWGNAYNPSFAFIYENAAARKQFGFWAPPGSFPADRSVYGAMDMAGNVREWTSSKFPGGSPFQQIKGASSATSRRFLHCAFSSDTPVIPSDVGFRYVILPEKQGGH